MSEFYEVYKMLVSYEMFHKGGSPHLVVISTSPDTQRNPGAVEFDYKSVWDREDLYKDVAGFYHTHPSGLNRMSQIDIDTMIQWVNCLGKSLLCVIETDEQINGWLFSKSDTGKVEWREVAVSTNNDLTYDVYLEPQEAFFNPVDFITDGDFGESGEPDFFESMQLSLNKLEENQVELANKFNKLLDLLKAMIARMPELGK